MAFDALTGRLDSETEAALLRALSARAEVCEAYLFGSQAAGAGQRHSDVDIAVYVDPSADISFQSRDLFTLPFSLQ